MAYNLVSGPDFFMSAFGDIIFIYFEDAKAIDPVTYPDYKYVLDVYVNAVLVARLKSYPRPDTKFGVFNIGSIVRSYIAAVFKPNLDNIYTQIMAVDEFKIDVTVKAGEEYGFTTYTNVLPDSARTYFGHYNGRAIGTATLLANYYDAPITFRPSVTKIYRNEDYNLLPYFLSDAGVRLQIKKYDAENNLLDTLDYNVLSGPDQICKVYNLSPSGINAESSGFIDDTVDYYTCQFNPSVPGPLYRFDLVCEPKFTVYTLHFLNRFGAFESRSFTKLSRKIIDIEKQDYGRLPYLVNASGETITYFSDLGVYNETRSVYSSQYKEKMVLNTDVLTDAEYTWLGDLILSPLVYMGMEGYFVPIVIAGTNYEFRKSINDKVTNLTINVEFGEQFNTQYR